MGKLARRTLGMNPALAVFLRRFVIVPSMLLVCLFCLWTLLGLAAFSLFSHSGPCAGKECTAASFYPFKSVTKRGLNMQQQVSEGDLDEERSFFGESIVDKEVVTRGDLDEERSSFGEGIVDKEVVTRGDLDEERSSFGEGIVDKEVVTRRDLDEERSSFGEGIVDKEVVTRGDLDEESSSFGDGIVDKEVVTRGDLDEERSSFGDGIVDKEQGDRGYNVGDLEFEEVDSGEMQVEADTLLKELKFLGYRGGRSLAGGRRKTKEETMKAHNAASRVEVSQERSSIGTVRKTGKLAGKGERFGRVTSHVRNGTLEASATLQSNSIKLRQNTTTGSYMKQLNLIKPYVKQASLNTTKESFAKQASMNEDNKVEEEEKQIIGAGLQKIMRNLRSYSTTARDKHQGSCAGRWVYSYYLPSKFNSDLTDICDTILPWYSLCEYFENSGMGKLVNSLKAENILLPSGRWHQTNQYMLEVLFHARLKEYECLTGDPSKATLFHIPYYGGIDVFRYHYANVTFEKKDELGRELIKWLDNFPMWRRHGGRDHFLVLGKITWDFRRTDTDWGNTLLLFPELQNVSKLLIEREPWQENDIGAPHPTFFHPQSDSDMDAWLAHVGSFRRDSLVSFAGMPRTTDNIRSILIDKCRSNPILCRFLECSGKVCFRPETTMRLFLRSHFCLQPIGDSATRRSVFDSLIAGCIPVLLSRDTAYIQYPWHLPRQISSYSVFVPAEDVKTRKVDVIKKLAAIPKETRQRMRNMIVREVIPKLVYFTPNANHSYEDAFDVSLRSLLEKSRRIHVRET